MPYTSLPTSLLYLLIACGSPRTTLHVSHALQYCGRFSWCAQADRPRALAHYGTTAAPRPLGPHLASRPAIFTPTARMGARMMAAASSASTPPRCSPSGAT